MTAGPEPSAGTRSASRRPWQQLSTSWRSGPLAVRGFRLLVAGSLASMMGDFCYAVALPWLVLPRTAVRSCSVPCWHATGYRARW
jgi:hypothetical protein